MFADLTHGKGPDAERDWRQRRRGKQRMRWLDSIANSVDMNLSKPRETVEGRGVQHATVHGITESQTQLRDWTTNNYILRVLVPRVPADTQIHGYSRPLYKMAECTWPSTFTDSTICGFRRLWMVLGRLNPEMWSPWRSVNCIFI